MYKLSKINNVKYHIAALLLVLFIVKPYIAFGEISKNAIMSAIIVNRVLSIEALEEGEEDKISFELSANIGGEGEVTGLNNREVLVSRMLSEPNTIMKVYYGDRALSKEDNAENKKGYAMVTLINEDGDRLQVKVKIDNSKIVFDKDGKGQLHIGSEFLIGDNQPKGNYRAFYHIIVSY
ncbi:MAG: hypothetical protein O3B09_01965 [Proteobacteria bacterium]|nr:hypothetical protein [Pseudomonadota bacterium]